MLINTVLQAAAQIAGMQVATGTETINTEYDEGTKNISCQASVTGLAFAPKVVILISTEYFNEIFAAPSNVFVGAIKSVANADEYWISHFLISNVNGNFYGNKTLMNLYGGKNIYDFYAKRITNKPAWFSFTDKGFSISISESLDGSKYFNNTYSWYAFG